MSRRTRKGDVQVVELAPKIPVREGAPRRRERGPTRIRARNPERAARTLAEDFGDLADLVRRLPCCVVGCRRRPSDPAHVRSRGAGGHAWIVVDGVKVGNIAPLCHSHHTGGPGVARPQHGVGNAAFEAENKLELCLPYRTPRACATLAEVAATVGVWSLEDNARADLGEDAPC